MSWLFWFFALRLCSSLLLVGLVCRQLGLRVGLQVVQTATCSRWGALSDQGLFQEGDVVIGGLFSLYYKPPAIDSDFTQLPYYKPCTGLQNLPLQYIYAMVFAVEEINHSTTLLPGVKLGYHIRDSCGLPLWAMQAALSLVGGDSASCNSTDYSAGEGIRERRGDQNVPLIIGGSSSKTAQILSRILGPLAVPLMSYTASCPCLSDRRQFPNFFRTMPSDIYQARAIAQLSIRFNWTWIGAVVANNDYGLVAIKVFQEETRGAGVCLAFVETLQRENIVSDARRAALTIQASTAKVILIFTWYTDVRELFLQLAKINVTDRQFLATHALHSLLSCPDRDSSSGNNSFSCFSPKHIKPEELMQHLSNLNFTTPQGDMFYFQGADIPAKYDLVNWQETPEGSLKLVLIGRVDGFDLHLNESAIQWSTGSNQVPVSVCTESCPPGTRKANRKGEPLCCFDCIQCAEGEISNQTDSLHSVTTAVFVVFLYYRQTPMVRANNSELSFLLLLSLKLCFLCSLVFIGQQRGSVCLFSFIQVFICIIWLLFSPPVPQVDLDIPGLKVTLECAMASVCFIILLRPEKNTRKYLMAR
ncbi:hypothetical protein VZT92_020837 [Zoarces viviparus]|uniref:G-protein coupled receptors family 3 profile domain-containing protein n=1 Tax=Zoarces viviparus TaxID=48416 RepID=A0AAW1EE93_ZOAVI